MIVIIIRKYYRACLYKLSLYNWAKLWSAPGLITARAIIGQASKELSLRAVGIITFVVLIINPSPDR